MLTNNTSVHHDSLIEESDNFKLKFSLQGLRVKFLL